jgi:hypothetical protein
LYGSWKGTSKTTRTFIENTIKNGHYQELLDKVAANEKDINRALVEFDKEYKGTLKEANIDEIIEKLSKKQ